MKTLVFSLILFLVSPPCFSSTEECHDHFKGRTDTRLNSELIYSYLESALTVQQMSVIKESPNEHFQLFELIHSYFQLKGVSDKQWELVAKKLKTPEYSAHSYVGLEGLLSFFKLNPQLRKKSRLIRPRKKIVWSSEELNGLGTTTKRILMTDLLTYPSWEEIQPELTDGLIKSYFSKAFFRSISKTDATKIFKYFTEIGLALIIRNDGSDNISDKDVRFIQKKNRYAFLVDRGMKIWSDLKPFILGLVKLLPGSYYDLRRSEKKIKKLSDRYTRKIFKKTPYDPLIKSFIEKVIFSILSADHVRSNVSGSVVKKSVLGYVHVLISKKIDKIKIPETITDVSLSPSPKVFKPNTETNDRSHKINQGRKKQKVKTRGPMVLPVSGDDDENGHKTKEEINELSDVAKLDFMLNFAGTKLIKKEIKKFFEEPNNLKDLRTAYKLLLDAIQNKKNARIKMVLQAGVYELKMNSTVRVAFGIINGRVVLLGAGSVKNSKHEQKIFLDRAQKRLRSL